MSMNRVYQALIAELARRESLSVIDVGCGPGTYFNLLPAHVRTRYAIDAFSLYLTKIESGIRMLGRAEDLLPTFADESVDVVYALDFIEHLDKDAGVQVLLEMRRIAAHAVVIFTPHGFQAQEGDVLGQGADHWQTHRSGWWPADFESRGFTVDVWPDFDYGKGAGITGEPAIWATWRRT